MFDRHFLGDIAVAMILVLPTAAFARSQVEPTPPAQQTQAAAKATPAETSMDARGVGLLG